MIALQPDVEQLVIGFLLDQEEIVDLVAGRVYSELPATKTFPAVRVRQFNDQQASGPALWLVRSSLQIDVWGGPKKLTRTIADTIRAVIVDRITGAHPEGVVTGAVTRGLDTTADPGLPSDAGKDRPRCRFDLDLWVHPGPDVGS